MLDGVLLNAMEKPQNVVLVTFLLIITVYLISRKKYKLPPGPIGIPLLGWIPFFTETDLQLEALHLGRKFKSDIVSLYVGTQLVVVMNSAEIIQEAFKKNGEQLQDRGHTVHKVYNRGAGVLHADGELWKEQRRYAMSVLRDFGMGKEGAEKLIMDEIMVLKDEFEKTNGEIITPYHLLSCASSNIICALVFGERFNYDDEAFLQLLASLEKLVLATNIWLANFPKLRYVPGNFFKYGDIKACRMSMTELAKKGVKQHKEEFEEHGVSDYIASFLAEIKKRKADTQGNSTFTEEQLLTVIVDFFSAGTETTSSTLRWGLGLMAMYPNVQQKVFEEIESKLGRDHIPTLKDKLLMPYTEAVLLEIQRWASLVPLGLPHTNLSQDVKIRDYDIPKGTNVFANLYSVMRDVDIWPYPNEFNPENFIAEPGKLGNQEHMVGFAIGKRACLGEALARMELFMIFTSLIQAFEIQSVDGKTLMMKHNPGLLLRSPKRYSVRFVKRN